MATNKKSAPDYKFWSKLDVWNFKEAALLLHEIEPHEYMQVKFTTREIPTEPELREPHKTFLILKKMNWGKNYSYGDSGETPQNIYFAAFKKGLDIPEELSQQLGKHHKEEAENEKLINKNPDELTTRERRNLLKLIAYMTHIIADCRCTKYQCKINDRPNASQIAEAILDKAVRLRKETDGLRSSNRKIVQALEFLDEEN